MRLGYINHDFSMFDSHPFFSERQDLSSLRHILYESILELAFIPKVLLELGIRSTLL
jgi:hypothetical protein